MVSKVNFRVNLGDNKALGVRGLCDRRREGGEYKI
jgi:hypothetical protein